MIRTIIGLEEISPVLSRVWPLRPSVCIFYFQMAENIYRAKVSGTDRPSRLHYVVLDT